MPDTKISALPAVVAPLGTDEFAVNQGAVSKKITLTQVNDNILLRNDIVFKNAADSVTGFQVLNQGGSTPILIVDTVSGLVGINTAVPSAALDVVGLSGAADRFKGVLALCTPATIDGLRMGIFDASHMWIQSFSGLPLRINELGNAVTFNGIGSLGIGPDNTSPIGTLHVQDATPTTGDTKVVYKEGAATSNNLFEAHNSSGALGLIFPNYKSIRVDSGGTFGLGTGVSFGDGDTQIFENSDDVLRFRPGLNSIASFQFLNVDSSVVILNIDTLNRRIGIGTAAPGTSLHIFDPNPLIRLQDSTGVGNAAVAFIAFYDTTVRQGVIGFGSSSNSNLNISNEVAGGHIRLDPGAAADVKIVASDLYTEGDGWQEFTTTTGGFSSTTIQEIWYKKVGKTVFVNFHISGDSNGTNLTFTLPFINTNDTDVEVRVAARVADNGSFLAAPGMTFLGVNSSTVSVFKDFIGATFTASGVKAVQGQMWYQTP